MVKEQFRFTLTGQDLAIDLGTTNTLVYGKRSGVILNAPSVLAVNKKDGRVLAVGWEAKHMLGKTPDNIAAIRPIRDGVITDFDATRKMVGHFLSQVQSYRAIIGRHLIVGVSSQATKMEKRALLDITRDLGAKKVSLVVEPVAVVIGANLPISEPVGIMVVDIGGGTSEAAITSLNGVVMSNSVGIAGDEMDQAIIQHMRENYNLFIGEQRAERIRIDLGYGGHEGKGKRMKVRGRDLSTGFPKEVGLDSEEMKEILDPLLAAILDMIEVTLEQCPPELAGDIMDKGIYLTGGGACLTGISMCISKKVKLPVREVPEPLLGVVLGLGRLLESHHLLSAVEVAPNANRKV